MILVADSGSTKCDWILEDSKGNKHETSTMGFNPFFHNSDLIENEIKKNSLLSENARSIELIYFFGAGCSSNDRKEIVEIALKSVFPNLKACVVNHDLLGACISTAGSNKGICCILGTGSNSCYYDGHEILENSPSLGYILGDEGSGSFFGKKLLRDWIYHRMPSEIHAAFSRVYQTNREEILNKIYKADKPNVYLASFAEFAGQNISHPYIHNLIYNGLKEFAQYHILCYADFNRVPVHFVGSIAFHFQLILLELAKDLGFQPGIINKRPIIALSEYYSQINH